MRDPLVAVIVGNGPRVQIKMVLIPLTQLPSKGQRRPDKLTHPGCASGIEIASKW
jgi:hypothetical protein